MQDLHLTDDELKDLAEMGPLGEHVVKMLEMWRAGGSDNWKHETIDHGSYDDVCQYESITSGNGPRHKTTILYKECAAVEEDTAAIVYARNTAELRTALVYWTLNHRESKHMADTFTGGNVGLALMQDDADRCAKKVGDIAAAIEDMKQ